MKKACSICYKDLGEINRARLLKKTALLCSSCWDSVTIWGQMATTSRSNESFDFEAMFKDGIRRKV